MKNKERKNLKEEDESFSSKSNDNNNSYNDFNINTKQLMKKLKYHSDKVTCLCLLDDGRLVSGSKDNNIIIYNKITYEQDLIIREHRDTVNCLIKLNSNTLASCSSDKTIKVFKIKGNNYEILQTLNEHKDRVNKIIKLINKNLVSGSNDNSIIFYDKINNNKYQKNYLISINGWCQSLTQTKENEICYLEYDDDYYNIVFYDLKERKIKTSITDLNITGDEPFNMITKDLLIIGGYNEIYIINVNQYKLIKIIDVFNAGLIFGFCMLNNNMFLTGGEDKMIRQWKIEDQNISLFSKKEEADENIIFGLVKIGNGNIASISDDNSIKIW